MTEQELINDAAKLLRIEVQRTSQSEVARRLDVTRQYVSLVVVGKYTLSNKLAFRIVATFGGSKK